MSTNRPSALSRSSGNKSAPVEQQLERGQTIPGGSKMSNDTLQPFNYEGNEVRTFNIDGEPWFVLNDVCKVLEIASPRNVVARLPSEYVRQADALDGRGISRPHTIISEGGLYRVVLRSDKPEAEPFQRWVETDVLPAIRKTGSYQVEPQLPRTYLEALKELVTATERTQELEAQAAVTAPKAAAFDDLLGAEGDYTVTSAAKLLSRAGIIIGPRKLFEHLRDIGWLYRSGKYWVGMQKQIARGHLTERARMYRDDMTGENRVSEHPQVRITPKGLARLRDEFLGEVAA